MITDHNIAWLRKRVFKTYWELLGVISNTSVAAEGDGVISALTAGGVGPVFDLAEVSTSGIVTIGTATTGSDIAAVWKIPYDFDPQWPVGMRLFCVGAGTVNFTPTMLYRVCKKDEDISTAPATALNTVFTLTALTASTFRVTNRGIINRLAITREDVENGALLVMNIDCVVSAATRAGILGIEFDYAPQLCLGHGNEADPPLTNRSL